MSFIRLCKDCQKPMIYQPSAVQYWCPRCKRFEAANAPR